MVLVVDDEPVMRSVAAKMLERLGHAVLVAADGAEALGIWHQQRHSLRCIVLDVSMPGLDGPAVVAELQRLGSTTPVVLASGHDRPPTGTGCAGYVRKPYRMQQLAAAVAAAIAG